MGGIMRYPLVLFLFVFVVPPFALHALLTGRAALDSRPAASDVRVLPDDAERIHHWRVAGAR